MHFNDLTCQYSRRLKSGDDLNSLNSIASQGNYVVYGGSYPDNSPIANISFIIKVEVDIKNGRNIQTVKTLSDPVGIYIRRSTSNGWTQWVKISQASRDAGWNYGVYINIGGTNGFAVFVPYDVSNKGVPRIARIDINFVGEYSTNPSVISSHPNGFYCTSDNLPQSANYVGNICSVYISAQS